MKTARTAGGAGRTSVDRESGPRYGRPRQAWPGDGVHAPLPRRPRRSAFSLIEVVLALAVIAFGVVSVLALLPASLKSNRDSVADTHSAQTGEHLVETLAAAMEIATSADTWAATALVLPTAKPGVTEPTEGWTQWLSQAGMTFWKAGEADEYQRVVMRRTDADAEEFTAVCRVWRRPVSVSRLVDDDWETHVLPWTEAVALNVEVSWPAEAPYAGRTKALYLLNTFRKAE